MIINIQGQENANWVLSMAGGVFVIPFLLFSSAAGVLADRIPKRSIIIVTKIAEILVMSASVVTAYFQSVLGSYMLLFFMAMQSAVFGPSKYGIIPELVDNRKISTANGLLTSFTYLAIIVGTYFASFITQITHKNFTIASCFCVAFAVLGFFASLGIVKTPAKGTKKRINPFFLYEIYQSLKIAYGYQHLVTAIFGSAFFLFIGGFTQLNIIPFAMQSLGLSAEWGGYLFLFTAIGIALGAICAGKISKDQVELGLSCISAFFLSFVFLGLYFFASHFWVIVTLLTLLGFGGGILLIPFDAFIQIKSPDNQRGRIIAAANFMSFFGVLLASLFLYLIGDRLDFSAASGFAAMGILTFVFSIFITGRFSSIFFPFISEKILLSRYALRLLSLPPENGSVIIYQKKSWLDLILLFSILKNLNIIIQKTKFFTFPFVRGLFINMMLVSSKKNREVTLEKVMKKASLSQKRGQTLLLYIDPSYTQKEIFETYQSVFHDKKEAIFSIDTKWDTTQKVFFSTSFQKKRISISFEKLNNL